MPSLSDVLDRIAQEAEQVHALTQPHEGSSLSLDRTAGPITTSYLNLPRSSREPRPTVYSLIRDASAAERRPFNIHQVEAITPSGAVEMRYQRLEPHTLTPLRNLPAARGTPQELAATLSAAEKVIDLLAEDHTQMTRGRRTVLDYHAQHEANLDRMEELERRIAAATKRTKPVAEEKKGKPKMSVEEAIAAEEEALKAMEAKLAPMRQRASERERHEPPRAMTPKAAPAARVRNSPSPKPVSHTPVREREPLRASLRTPARTPKQYIEPPASSRFSGRFMATPRAARPSTLPPGSTIVDRMRASISHAPSSVYRGSTQPPAPPLQILTEQTPSRPPPETTIEEATPIAPQVDVMPDPPQLPDPTPLRAGPVPPPLAPTPRPQPSVPTTPSTANFENTYEGVDMDLAIVAKAIETIHTVGSWLLGLCLRPDETVEKSPVSTIAHLVRVARADSENMPSPGSPNESRVPLTPDDILIANICLVLLRNASEDDPEGAMGSKDVMDELAPVVMGRGWAEQDRPKADSVIRSALSKGTGKRLFRRIWGGKHAVRGGGIAFA